MAATIPALSPHATPQEVLRTGVAAASGPVKLACSFSREDVVIIDMAHEMGLDIGVFALDTGRLNEETYEVSEALVDRYRLKIDWYFPRHGAVEKLLAEKGPHSFRESLENRHECCRIRKVEPLGRALHGLSGWVTGMRRTQGVTRGDLGPMELDGLNGGILKINPLLDWTHEQVLAYTRERSLPVNRLLSRGYCSIGCAPCTRAIGPGEDCRAGRWWWENPENRECGLHRR